jgi:RNA polymerase sigma-70 factor, ECF subfamily
MTDKLLERILGGDEAAWRELLDQHREALTRFCARFFLSADDAADAAQDAFLRAWQFRHTFRGESGVKAWLYRIAENVCRNRLRGRGAPLSLDDAANTEVVHLVATGPTVAEQVAARHLVAAIIERLEEPDRTIFVLHYQMELSSEEISRRLPSSMRMGPEGVRSRLSRGIKKMIQDVGEEFHIRA